MVRTLTPNKAWLVRSDNGRYIYTSTEPDGQFWTTARRVPALAAAAMTWKGCAVLHRGEGWPASSEFEHIKRRALLRNVN